MIKTSGGALRVTLSNEILIHLAQLDILLFLPLEAAEGPGRGAPGAGQSEKELTQPNEPCHFNQRT